MRLFPLLLILTLFFAACKGSKNESEVKASYFLVRHAEKVKNMRDPGLTKEGKERAYFLVEFLKAERLDAVYSTDYYRTRKTAQPTCSARFLNMQIYDANDLETFAANIKKKHPNGNVLIVGHSNTTPQLASYIADAELAEDLEDWQYDQLFKVTLYTNKKSQIERLKFGRPSEAPKD